MFELWYAPIVENKGIERSDWELYGEYDTVIEAAQGIYECVDADFENNTEYAYRIVEEK